MDNLKNKAKELGVKVDGRWSDERLQQEIDAALAEQDLAVHSVTAMAIAKKAIADSQLHIEERAHIKAEGEEAKKAGEKAELEAQQAKALEEEEARGSVTVINLQANPMSNFGLSSYGEAVITKTQLSDPHFAAKMHRAIELGLIKIKQ